MARSPNVFVFSVFLSETHLFVISLEFLWMPELKKNSYFQKLFAASLYHWTVILSIWKVSDPELSLFSPTQKCQH